MASAHAVISILILCSLAGDSTGQAPSDPTTAPLDTWLTYNYTGSEQSVVAPASATVVQARVYGAQGGKYDSGLGGLGGLVEAMFPVTAGQSLYLYVGGAGTSPGYCSFGGQGYNGGGNGVCGGGGGGGASDIRLQIGIFSSRIMVAGGGGGGAYGSGGGCGGGQVACGGRFSTGGSQSYGGQICYSDSSGVALCENGTFGFGSDGHVCGAYCCGTAGGGGGGWYGGGGGKCDQGAAGGSSYCSSDCLVMQNIQGNQTGDGKIELKFLQFYESTATTTTTATQSGTATTTQAESTTSIETSTASREPSSTRTATMETTVIPIPPQVRTSQAWYTAVPVSASIGSTKLGVSALLLFFLQRM